MTTLNFNSVPNWTFSQEDQKASDKLQTLRQQATDQLPPDYKSSPVFNNLDRILTLFDEIKQTKLYGAFKTIPKGVVHHVHFDCCEDQDFYAQHVITDPIVYLGANLDSFNLGTKEQADTQGWVTMKNARQKFNSDIEFVKHVSNLTMMNKQQIQQNFTLSQAICWDKFEKKISNFFPILGAVHLFKKYTVHILRKFIKNGYTRLQFRSLLTCLTEFSQSGEIVKVYDQKKFMDVFDQAFEIVKGQYAPLSVGFIFFGLKMLKPEDNIKLLSNVLDKRWPKTVGIDFVQQQDPFGSQVPYDDVANIVLAKFPDLDIKKVYHVGETKDHLNRNIELAINAGTVRIGHGINILQHPDLIDIVREKKICFEKSPISNLLLSYVRDPRVATAQLLLGLGVPVTINPDDPGKFGVQDTTIDYFITFISSNWDLRHLKLVAIYSINHSICSEQLKAEILNQFSKRWNVWVSDFLQN